MTFIVDNSKKIPLCATIKINSPEESSEITAGMSQILKTFIASTPMSISSFYRNFGKRFFDIVLGSLMLLALAPRLLTIFLIVAIDWGWPIFARTPVG